MEKFDIFLKRSDISRKFHRISSIGWILADLTERYFVNDEFIRSGLGLREAGLSFEDFLKLVNSDDRERISMGLDIMTVYGAFDLHFRIGTAAGETAVHMKFDGMERLNDHRDVSYGFMQFLPYLDDTVSNWNIINSQFKELMYWQNSLPQSLTMLLYNRSYSDVVSDMLQSIVERFNADKACFFEFDWAANTQSCICEIIREDPSGNTCKGHTCSAQQFPWLNRQFESRKAVVINNVGDMPKEAGNEKEVFSEQGIVSIIVVPMHNKQGVWGHISMASVSAERHWTEIEINWFTAISNIVSICLELHYSNKEVRRERKHLRYLQKNMPVGLEVYDRNGLLIEQNDRAMEMLGFRNREEMLAFRIQLFENTFIPEEKREALRRGESIACEVLFEETPFSSRFFKNTDGRPKNIMLNGAALFDDNQNIINYITILSDHTEILRAHYKLHEFDNMFRLISEFSEIGFFRANLLDPVTDIYATDQWFANLNISREYMQTISGLVPDTINPEDAVSLGNFMKNAVYDRSYTECHMELRVKNADGTVRWLRTSLKVVEHDPAKGKVIIFGVNIDITSLKNVEFILIDAKNKAEESDRLKSAFLANMSHEIRTPLNAIIGFSSLIVESLDREELREYASIINKNNDLLLQLISDVLDLSRIEAGIFDIALTNTDINRLCEEVIQSNSLLLPQGVELIFDSHLPMCDVLCDRNRITQVLNNMINNALKFTKEGSVRVGYRITRDDTNPQLELYVQDTGIGMTPEDAAICFDRFVKIDTFVQGLGLGLSICKTVVERLGGKIGVDTEPGKGSRFWFTIPFSPTDNDTELHDDLTVYTKDGRKPVVLIAEDMKVNYILISKMLRPYYTVIIVQNGEDAVRVHSEKKPDLILMDLKMPKMNGLEATRKIRETDRQTPIIAITAFAFDFDREQAVASGCNYMITKPINPMQLRKIIRNFIKNGNYVPKKRNP